MMKDLFSGSLGKLNNHGGSRIYTTPHTILVPPEYEVDIGTHGDFVSCSLDGRLWLFKNKIVALKWNKDTGRMEFSASRTFNNDAFIQRGIDWLLTKRYIIQYNEGKIVVEQHKISSIAPMENFYSLLPAIDGFQIIKGYLIRKPGADYPKLTYPIESNIDFLTHKDKDEKDKIIDLTYEVNEDYVTDLTYNKEIWCKKGSSIGKVSIEAKDGAYVLEIGSTYSVNDSNVTGIIFLNNKLYGFQAEENLGLCYASQNLNLYSFEYGEWETISDSTGKIYLDVFNHKALALHDKGIEILPDRKKVECNTLEQWIAPSKEIHYVSNNIIISAFNNNVLSTDLICKYYRSLLQNQRELPLTATAYQKNKEEALKFAVGSLDNNLKFNSLNVEPFIEEVPYDIEIELLNVFEHEYSCLFYDKKNPYRNVFRVKNIEYDLLLQPIYVYCDFAYENETVEYVELLGVIAPGLKTWKEWKEIENTYEQIANSRTAVVDGFYLIGFWHYNEASIYSRRYTNGYIFGDAIRQDKTYFLIDFETGNFTDKEITLEEYYTTYTTEDGEKFFKSISDIFIQCQQDKNVIYLGCKTGGNYTNLEIFTDGWRILDIHENYDFFQSKEFFENNVIGYIDLSITFEHDAIIASHGNLRKKYILTETQQELLKNYSSLETHCYYYNVYKKNEFAHVLIFKNPNNAYDDNYDDEKPYKCLFFVFRSRLKTRSKV